MLVVLGCAAALILILLLVTRKTKSPFGRACAVCGAEPRYGYSEHAEEVSEKIRPMCLKCLVSQLEKDYEGYAGRAIVVQPAAGPPCYVFQTMKGWREHFKESKIADDGLSLLATMEPRCHECGLKAKYLWIESRDLTGDNFGECLDRGFSETLLRHNPKPVSLCAGCCVKRIAQDLELKHLSYLEVCAPRGTDEGFVIPMGY
jgi:hypothetical protein